MDKEEVINKLKAYKILVKSHLEIDKMYLFGSYARNTNTNESDIDVAIIVNKADKDFFKVNPLLWKLRRQIDDRIEPFLIEKDFDDADFIGEVSSYGIEI